MKRIFQTNPIIFFWIFIILVCLAYNYYTIIQLPPRSVHQWRQADCYSFAMNYYKEGLHFFSPSVNWIGPNGNGKTASEFPIIYYTVACLWKIFGKHEWIFRLVNLTLSLFGLFYLFKLSLELTKNKFWSFFIPFLLFSSPIYAYYANNFISNVPALSLVFPGWYFFYRFYKVKKTRLLYLSMFFFLVAGLLKISSAISFVIILGIFLSEWWRIIRYKKEDRIFNKPVKQLVPFLLVISIILSWNLYVFYYNLNNNAGVLLQGVLPIWEIDAQKIHAVFQNLYHELLPQYFSNIILFILCGMFVFLIVFYKKVNRILFIITLCAFIISCCYILLFFQVFIAHDYYLIDLLILPVAILTTFAIYLKKNHSRIFRMPVVYTIAGIILIYNLYYCAVYTRIKYNSEDKLAKRSFILSEKEHKFWDWFHWNYSNKYKAFEDITPYLRSLGISRTDRVISIPDISINITLSQMDQKGFTDYSYSEVQGKERITAFIRSGAKYLIINDQRILNEDYLKPFLINKIGEYKNICIYSLYGFSH
jgi:hypothetical protein